MNTLPDSSASSASKIAPSKYWAFLSYSHQDKQWADWLHRSLETYRVPPRLIGKSTERGEVVPRRVFPIFRDREELPSSSDLGGNIRAALEQSRFLIVICSPCSARSRWVSEEIRTFKAMGRADRVLCLVVDGEPHASEQPGREEQECFAEPLRFQVNPHGEITREPAEPIAADARRSGDGRHNAKLKLLAGLLGVGFDELAQRDRQRTRNRHLQIAGALLLLAGGIAFWNHRLSQTHLAEQAEEKRRHEELQAEQVRTHKEQLRLGQIAQWTEDGRLALSDGDHVQALRSLLDAYRAGGSSPALRLLLHSAASRFNGLAATLSGHTDQVTAVAFSRDGTRVVTASMDGTAKVWSVPEGRLIFTTPKGQSGVTEPAFSSDGKWLLTETGGDVALWNLDEQKGAAVVVDPAEYVTHAAFLPGGHRVFTIGSGGAVQIWEGETGRLLHSLKSENRDSLPAFAFSTNGALVAIGNARGLVEIFDSISAQLVSRMQGKGNVTALVFSPDGEKLAAGGDGGLVRLWSFRQGAEPVELRGHRGGIEAVTFSENGGQLLSYGGDSQLKRWSVVDGNLQSSITIIGSGAGGSARFSSGGRWLNLLDQDGNATIWNTDSGKPRAEMNLQAGEISDFALSPDGNWTVTASRFRTPRLWEVGKVTSSLHGTLRGHEGSLSGAEFSGDGALVVTSGIDNRAVVWDFKKAAKIATLSGHRFYVLNASFDPQGKRVLTASQDGTAMVWNAESGEALATLPMHSSLLQGPEVVCAAWSPDGRWIACGSSGGRFALWDSATYKLIRDITPQAGSSRMGIAAVRFSLDGERIVTTGYDGTILVRGIPEGEELWKVAPDLGPVMHCAWHSGGAVLAVGGQAGRGALLNAMDGSKLADLAGHTAGVTSVVFSPDGRRVLTTSLDETARLWDAKSGILLLTLAHAERPRKQPQQGFFLAPPMNLGGEGHVRAVLGGDFSPNGEFIVTACRDRLVRIWDAHSGTLLLERTGHHQPVVSARFSPDGSRLLTASHDQDARIWNFGLETRKPEELESLIRRAGLPH